MTKRASFEEQRTRLERQLAEVTASYDELIGKRDSLALEVGLGAPQAPLAAVEETLAKMQADLDRHQAALRELGKVETAAAERAERERVKELGRAYIASRNAVVDANIRMAEGIAKLAPLGATASTEGKNAAVLARELGLDGGRSYAAFGPATGWLGNLFRAASGSMFGEPKRIEAYRKEAMTALKRPWRTGKVDERLKELGL